MIETALQALRFFFTRDDGQDTFEYLLIITFAALIVAGIIAGFAVLIPEVLGTTCPTVDPIGSTGAGDCVTP